VDRKRWPVNMRMVNAATLRGTPKRPPMTAASSHDPLTMAAGIATASPTKKGRAKTPMARATKHRHRPREATLTRSNPHDGPALIRRDAGVSQDRVRPGRSDGTDVDHPCVVKLEDRRARRRSVFGPAVRDVGCRDVERCPGFRAGARAFAFDADALGIHQDRT